MSGRRRASIPAHAHRLGQIGAQRRHRRKSRVALLVHRAPHLDRARERLEHDDAERVDVGSLVYRLTTELLGDM